MIKKGDKFKCIRDVLMDDDSTDIAYYAGNIYISELDGCITDERRVKTHYWDECRYTEEGNALKDYFVRVSKEMVNHPSHYKNGKYEAIDVMTDVFGKDKVADFCELNAFKYLWRADNKGTDIQDKKKAIWYLNKYIELKEKT